MNFRSRASARGIGALLGVWRQVECLQRRTSAHSRLRADRFEVAEERGRLGSDAGANHQRLAGPRTILDRGSIKTLIRFIGGLASGESSTGWADL